MEVFHRLLYKRAQVSLKDAAVSTKCGSYSPVLTTISREHTIYGTVCRPQLFMPKEVAASFKAINRLDLHALEDVTDKQLQDLAAAQHIPLEESLLAETLRKLHGGSICSRSECPSVTGSLSRAESFDMDDATSEATCTSGTAAGMAKQQLTPLRRRMNLPRRAATSVHSSKPSIESIGSPVMSTTNKSSSSCLWPPPKAAADPVADAPTPSSPTPHTLPDLPSCSQSLFMPAVALGDLPPLQSFHSATSFGTGSQSSSQQLSQPRRPRSACQAKRPPHPQSQACLWYHACHTAVLFEALISFPLLVLPQVELS